jgi:hypothetical protein
MPPTILALMTEEAEMVYPLLQQEYLAEVNFVDNKRQ